MLRSEQHAYHHPSHLFIYLFIYCRVKPVLTASSTTLHLQYRRRSAGYIFPLSFSLHCCSINCKKLVKNCSSIYHHHWGCTKSLKTVMRGPFITNEKKRYIFICYNCTADVEGTVILLKTCTFLVSFFGSLVHTLHADILLRSELR
jgi:hypothetical protein